VFAFTDTDNGELLGCQLNEKEEREIAATIQNRVQSLESAREAIVSGLSEEELKTLDLDQMHFVPLEEAQSESRTKRNDFVTDLTAPYFPEEETWKALGAGFKNVADTN